MGSPRKSSAPGLFPEFLTDAASTPANDEDEMSDSSRSPLAHQPPQSQNWGNLGGMKWAVGNSIWNDTTVTTTSLAPPQGDENYHRRFSLRPESLVPSHQERKFSLAADHVLEYEPLRGDNSNDVLAPPKSRSRSKSSSAIFSPFTTEPIHMAPPNHSIGDGDSLRRQSSGGIWGEGNVLENSRRRSFTQPAVAFGAIWDQQQNGVDSIPSFQHQETLALPAASNENSGNRMASDRRFSHAPNLHSELFGAQEYVSEIHVNSLYSDYDEFDGKRRHSLAGPLYAPSGQQNATLYDMAPHADSYGSENAPSSQSTRYLNDAMEKVTLSAPNEAPPTYKDVNDYFENKEHRNKAWVEAGKNLSQQSQSGDSSTAHWPLYVVEFKAGRYDFFYIQDPSSLPRSVQRGDLAIVEADRGKDLGKVVRDDIRNAEQLEEFQASRADMIADSQFAKGVVPKRIYRLATNQEVSLLASKIEDESKALSICQSKIRQKNLPMEVVDTEYQWDRRKLTLYFVAERRIDFRELVRDLFKIYK